MTRKECEEKLLDLMDQAMAIYRECIPNAGSLTLHSDGKGYVNVSGHRQGFDPEAADYKDMEETYTLYTTRFSDGRTWFLEKWAEVSMVREGQA